MQRTVTPFGASAQTRSAPANVAPAVMPTKIPSLCANSPLQIECFNLHIEVHVWRREFVDLDDRCVADGFKNVLKSCHRHPLGACIDTRRNLHFGAAIKTQKPLRLDQDQGGQARTGRIYGLRVKRIARVHSDGVIGIAGFLSPDKSRGRTNEGIADGLYFS